MNPLIPIALSIVCILLILVERMGMPTTLQLSFRGDIKRESQWLAQYGQAVATGAAAALIWQFDPERWRLIIPLIVAVGTTSVTSLLMKRLIGRMRPNRPDAGKFMGPGRRHDNARESFPSSHTACAVALTVALAHFYPQGTETFWALALITGALRYVLDAHWPSDVVGGIALGYTMSWLILGAFGV